MLKAKVDAYFEPFRQKRKDLSKDPSIVEEIMREGARKARAEAQKTMEMVRQATGLASRL